MYLIDGRLGENLGMARELQPGTADVAEQNTLGLLGVLLPDRGDQHVVLVVQDAIAGTVEQSGERATVVLVRRRGGRCNGPQNG
jgi:hypothetical protein